jgi:hypothetical protein
MADVMGPGWRRLVRLLLIGALLVCGLQAGRVGVTYAHAGVGPDSPGEPGGGAAENAAPGLEQAIAAQERANPRLLSIAGVVGTAVGLAGNGGASILVFSDGRVNLGDIPGRIEDVPVEVHVTGRFHAMLSPEAKRGGGASPKSRFGDPVPIGVSTGNANECSAGTIGARVAGGGKHYALSNNHVYARENAGSPGELIAQPGLYDTQCQLDPADQLGRLAASGRITFSTSASNTIDAAIAEVNYDAGLRSLGTSTPPGGYGAPRTTTATPALDLAVQKFGRTSALTRGTITGINVTVNVDYGSAGVARFVNQITVTSAGPFIKPGDSGSLLVTDPDRRPVGLLFAGSSSGKYAIANPIGPVLQAFGVTIEGE